MAGLKLKATAQVAGTGGQSDWYRYVEGASNLPVNEKIGVTGIVIFQPTPLQVAKHMIAPIVIKTIVGDIRGNVYESKKSPGVLYFNGPQSEEVLADGTINYHNEVTLTREVEAQVLNYIESQIETADGQPVGASKATDLNSLAGATAPATPAVDLTTLPPEVQAMLAQAMASQNQDVADPFAGTKA